MMNEEMQRTMQFLLEQQAQFNTQLQIDAERCREDHERLKKDEERLKKDEEHLRRVEGRLGSVQDALTTLRELVKRSNERSARLSPL